ncbi:cellulase family glycosylhydrolase [Terriglobus albidus]|uniref:cellulase family glycosylhydrolase n=1 Tax=Terriglobus albidus TaxID=1592106 RepID=UPI0021E06DBA|nr:cellulase family glycosylhydrolase [Terriglobus albidus]
MILRKSLAAAVLALCFGSTYLHANSPRERWTEEQAWAYMRANPWPVGSNFLPVDAINELEMFQRETYNPAEIDKEFGWAESTGMNTMRIFLHDLLWQQDAAGFKQRLDNLLTIGARHHIKPVLVLFDSCWDPDPKLGPQHPPIPGIHNSGWVQSPGIALADPANKPRFEAYVKGIVGAFANDDRILAWDVWNEPDNPGGGRYANNLKDKTQLMNALLPQVFAWARSQGPKQPLTSGVWTHDAWDDPANWSATEKIQLTESDIISFHDYSWPEKFESRVAGLEKLHRPLLCTEYMARGAGSTIDTILPIAAAHHVGMINWGLVEGKMQTNLPWDSWQVPYVGREPTVWFHDLFYPDGHPYREREIEILRDTARKMNVKLGS